MTARPEVDTKSAQRAPLPLFAVASTIAFAALALIAIISLARSNFDVAWIVVLAVSSIMLGNSIGAVIRALAGRRGL